MSREPLVHVVREAAGQAEGALILLHGRGADEHDLTSVLDTLDPERRLVGLTPGAPLPGPGGAGGRWWYMVPRVGYPDTRTFHATYAQLTSFLDAWLAERAIPWQRALIGGFSMGCVMSYATGLGPGRPRRPASSRSAASSRRSKAGRPSSPDAPPCPSSSRTARATPSSRSTSRATRAGDWRPPTSPSSTTSTRANIISIRGRCR